MCQVGAQVYICKKCKALPAQAFEKEIHTNAWEPLPNLSLGKYRYYLTFTDNYLWFIKVDILCTKDKTSIGHQQTSSKIITFHTYLLVYKI